MSPSAPGRFVVVYAREEEHAAREFCKYARRLTGAEMAAVTDEDFEPTAEACVISVGRNRVNHALIWDGLVDDYEANPNKDRFVIKTTSRDGQDYLVLAGYHRRGTLYAVYHYLEALCGVGFFQDGERVPEGRQLVLRGVDLVEEPRFSHRCVRFAPRPLLDRFFAGFWHFDRWRAALDWAMKRKFNTVELAWSAPGAFAKAFPECKGLAPTVKPWGWPEEYSAELKRKVLEYARKIGLSVIYWLAYPNLPAQFKEAHPELEYHRDYWQPYMSRAINICPAEPECKEHMRKYWAAIIEESGTDHKYDVSHVLPETRACERLDPTGRGIKAQAVVQAYEVLKSIDPEAEVHYWTWDLGCVHGFDTKIAQEYLAALPKDVVICDSWAWEPERRTREKFNAPFSNLYFEGRRWVLQPWYAPSFGDVLHGGFEHSVSIFKDVAQDLRAARCIGFNLGTELTSHNICLTQLMMALCWEPEGIGLDGYLWSYVEHRYGEASRDNMLASYRKLLGAVEHIRSFPPDHRLMGDLPQALGPHNPYSLLAAAIYSERCRSCWRKDEESIRLLREAIELAEREKEAQAGNGLYDAYVLELRRTCLHFVVRYHFAQAYFAYYDAIQLMRDGGDPAKQVDRFEQQAAVVVRSLDELQGMFEQHKEFSLDRMIEEEVMAVPGTTPDTPAIIREHSLYLATSFYNSTCCLELLRDVFKPMIDTIIDILRQKLRDRDYELLEVDMLFYAVEYWNKPWTADVSKQKPQYVGRIQRIIEGFIGRRT